MNTIDIVWTALTKTADNIERARESDKVLVTKGALHKMLREISEHVTSMKAFDSADAQRLARIEERLGIEP